jgi:hypothetical protein
LIVSSCWQLQLHGIPADDVCACDPSTRTVNCLCPIELWHDVLAPCAHAGNTTWVDNLTQIVIAKVLPATVFLEEGPYMILGPSWNDQPIPRNYSMLYVILHHHSIFLFETARTSSLQLPPSLHQPLRMPSNGLLLLPSSSSWLFTMLRGERFEYVMGECAI